MLEIQNSAKTNDIPVTEYYQRILDEDAFGVRIPLTNAAWACALEVLEMGNEDATLTTTARTGVLNALIDMNPNPFTASWGTLWIVKTLADKYELGADQHPGLADVWHALGAGYEQ